jgi:hypothetical protein
VVAIALLKSSRMANIDEQAATEELARAAHLAARAEELTRIAEALRLEAKRIEKDAGDLVAPS